MNSILHWYIGLYWDTTLLSDNKQVELFCRAYTWEEARFTFEQNLRAAKGRYSGIIRIYAIEAKGCYYDGYDFKVIRHLPRGFESLCPGFQNEQGP